MTSAPSASRRAMNTFSGLTSRRTSPRAWMHASAPASCAPTWRITRSGRLSSASHRRSSSSQSEPSAQSSITMHSSHGATQSRASQCASPHRLWKNCSRAASRFGWRHSARRVASSTPAFAVATSSTSITLSANRRPGSRATRPPTRRRSRPRRAAAPWRARRARAGRGSARRARTRRARRRARARAREDEPAQRERAPARRRPDRLAQPHELVELAARERVRAVGVDRVEVPLRRARRVPVQQRLADLGLGRAQLGKAERAVRAREQAEVGRVRGDRRGALVVERGEVAEAGVRRRAAEAATGARRGPRDDAPEPPPPSSSARRARGRPRS